MTADMVMIPLEEYKALKAADALLSKLHAAGVDSWEWYETALEDDDEG